MSSRSVSAVALAAVLASAFAIRYQGISFGLPILVHPDEAAIADPARRIATTGNLNPHTFLYPSLVIYAQALAYRVRYAVSDAPTMSEMREEDLYRAGRTLTVAFAVATILATYLLALEMAGPIAGIVAAIVTSVSELHVANSLPITTDMPMALLVVLASWFGLRIHTRGARMRDYVSAGLCAGLAASAKYNGVFAVLPILVAHLVTVPLSRRVLFDRRLVAAAAASVLGFFVATPYAIVDREPFFAFLRLQREAYSLGHPGAEQSGNSYGFYAAAMLHRFGAGGLAAAALGTGMLAYRRPRILAIFLAFPAALFLFMGAYPVRFDRNIVSLVSFAAIAAGYALAVVVDQVRTARARTMEKAAAWAVCALIVGTLASGSIGQWERSRAYTRLVTLPNTRWLAKVWIDENLPAGARIAREFYTPPIDAKKFRVDAVGYWGLIRTPQLERYDYLIASSDDFARFVDHANRYPEQAAAYYRIFDRYELVKQFVADWRTSTGPEIRIYRRPASSSR